MARGTKRTQTQIVTDKITKLNESIKKHQEKVDELVAQRSDLEKLLAELEEAERKATEEAKMKQLVKFMNEHKLTIEELENMMNNQL